MLNNGHWNQVWLHVTTLVPFDRRLRTVNRSSKHVFPTPESPTSKSLNKWSLDKEKWFMQFYIVILIYLTVGREEEGIPSKSSICCLLMHARAVLCSLTHTDRQFRDCFLWACAVLYCRDHETVSCVSKSIQQFQYTVKEIRSLSCSE